MSKEKAFLLIQYIILIVVGILFAVSIANADIIKYCIGIAILVLGAFMILKSLYVTKSMILIDGISGASLVALGVGTLCDFVPLISFGVSAISVIIAGVGGLFVVDSLIRFAKKNTTLGTVELIVGLVLLALGLMLCLWNEFKSYLWVIFGVLLAIYGIYGLVLVLTNKKRIFVVKK